MTADLKCIPWTQSLFASLANGGRWGIPRSGLVFEKRGGKLCLVARMPWMPEMAGKITAAKLREIQDADFEIIRENFAAAGIRCDVPK